MEKQTREQNAYLLFCKRLAVTGFSLLALCALFVFAFDPFYHYHRPWFGLRPVLTEKEYQTGGTLTHFSYDALLLGSSLTENHDLSLIDEMYGVTCVKAVRASGHLFDLCAFADRAFAERALTDVFFNIDIPALHGADYETFEAYGYPVFLDDRNPFNDISYLLNKTVLLRHIPYEIAQSASAAYSPDRPYAWYEGKVFSKEAVLSHYRRKREQAQEQDGKENEARAARIRERICALVEAHPETRFHVFMSPYSMIFWDDVSRQGGLTQTLQEIRALFERLLSYDNVTLYFFCDARDIITDLDRYMDFSHFDKEVNDWMIREMANPKSESLLTKENLDARMEGMRALIEELLKEEIRALEEEGAFFYEDTP